MSKRLKSSRGKSRKCPFAGYRLVPAFLWEGRLKGSRTWVPLSVYTYRQRRRKAGE